MCSTLRDGVRWVSDGGRPRRGRGDRLRQHGTTATQTATRREPARTVLSAARDTLIYDDNCPMCTFQSRTLTWLDWRHVIRLAPISHPETRRIAPDLTREQLHEAIHCVTPEGRVHRGARAIRHLGLRVPALWPSSCAERSVRQLKLPKSSTRL